MFNVKDRQGITLLTKPAQRVPLTGKVYQQRGYQTLSGGPFTVTLGFTLQAEAFSVNQLCQLQVEAGHQLAKPMTPNVTTATMLSVSNVHKLQEWLKKVSFIRV